MKYSLFLFLLFLTNISYSQETIFSGLEGAELLTKLVEEYKPRIVLEYAEAREYMYETLQHQKDTVEGIYTGFKIYLPANEPSRSWTYNHGINAEHIYPRSKGAHEENGNAFSDLHHLKPSKANVNSSRLNHPFREIDDVVTKKWFRSNQSILNIPVSQIDEYSELDSFVTHSGFITGKFEPRESVKGDIARAALYFFTMYNREALDADNTYFESMRTDLCNWHISDPADEDEIEFTNLIAEVQDGKANPFILDCSLALRGHCANMNLKCVDQTTAVIDISKDERIHVYPNPSNGFTNLKWSGDINLMHFSVYDIYGQKVYSHSLNNSYGYTINLSLSSGLYSLVAMSKNGLTFSSRLIIHN